MDNYDPLDDSMLNCLDVELSIDIRKCGDFYISAAMICGRKWTRQHGIPKDALRDFIKEETR